MTLITTPAWKKLPQAMEDIHQGGRGHGLKLGHRVGGVTATTTSSPHAPKVQPLHDCDAVHEDGLTGFLVHQAGSEPTLSRLTHIIGPRSLTGSRRGVSWLEGASSVLSSMDWTQLHGLTHSQCWWGVTTLFVLK